MIPQEKPPTQTWLWRDARLRFDLSAIRCIGSQPAGSPEQRSNSESAGGNLPGTIGPGSWQFDGRVMEL
jgi:hypothetical protein